MFKGNERKTDLVFAEILMANVALARKVVRNFSSNIINNILRQLTN